MLTHEALAPPSTRTSRYSRTSSRVSKCGGALNQRKRPVRAVRVILDRLRLVEADSQLPENGPQKDARAWPFLAQIDHRD